MSKKTKNLNQMETAYGRVLQLQKIKGAMKGDATLFRSTESGKCSSQSTGGCQIGGIKEISL